MIPVETLECDAVELDQRLFAERAETHTPGERALDVTREWLATNPDHVIEDGVARDLRTPYYARLLPDGRVYLASSLWQKHVRESGIEPSRVIKDWQASRWIEVKEERNGAGIVTRTSHSRRIHGEKCRVVVLNPGHVEIEREREDPWA